MYKSALVLLLLTCIFFEAKDLSFLARCETSIGHLTAQPQAQTVGRKKWSRHTEYHISYRFSYNEGNFSGIDRVKDYPEKQFIVYFDPDNPIESYAEKPGTWVWLTGIALALFGLWDAFELSFLCRRFLNKDVGVQDTPSLPSFACAAQRDIDAYLSSARLIPPREKFKKSSGPQSGEFVPDIDASEFFKGRYPPTPVKLVNALLNIAYASSKIKPAQARVFKKVLNLKIALLNDSDIESLLNSLYAYKKKLNIGNEEELSHMEKTALRILSELDQKVAKDQLASYMKEAQVLIEEHSMNNLKSVIAIGKARALSLNNKIRLIKKHLKSSDELDGLIYIEDFRLRSVWKGCTHQITDDLVQELDNWIRGRISETCSKPNHLIGYVDIPTKWPDIEKINAAKILYLGSLDTSHFARNYTIFVLARSLAEAMGFKSLGIGRS